jgi:AraC family transcriptional regulator
MAGIAIDLGEGRDAALRSAHYDPALQVSRGSAPTAGRTALHCSRLAQVEDWYLGPGTPARRSYDPGFQLILTYLGLCTFLTGEKPQLVDCNQALLVAPGWSAFQVDEASFDGYAAVIVKPSLELLEQVFDVSGANELRTFNELSAPSTMRLRILTQMLRAKAPAEPLQIDECLIAILAETSGAGRKRGTQASKAIERTKQLLHARAGEQLHLEEIAAEVGFNPVYLTQEFTRCEGVPLYRYQHQLRLTRALLELRGCEDITGLALDLGFSSHSHFTSAFRKAFGTTPSVYRKMIGASHERAGDPGEAWHSGQRAA